MVAAPVDLPQQLELLGLVLVTQVVVGGQDGRGKGVRKGDGRGGGVTEGDGRGEGVGIIYLDVKNGN